MAMAEILKRGTLGDLVRRRHGGSTAAVRELGAARFGCRWLARRLARREARALEWLEGIDGVPALIAHDRNRLVRSFLDGEPMHRARPDSRTYFRNSLRLLRQLHRRGVAHNDLAKEANWICGQGQAAGIVDFQLAYCLERRSRWFRLLAREDLRHWLKHKAHYGPDALSASGRPERRLPRIALGSAEQLGVHCGRWTFVMSTTSIAISARDAVSACAFA